MLGSQEPQGELQDKLSPHLEPDQEVAAVLATGINTRPRHVLSDVDNATHWRNQSKQKVLKKLLKLVAATDCVDSLEV